MFPLEFLGAPEPGSLEHWFSAQKQEKLRRSSADAGPGGSWVH